MLDPTALAEMEQVENGDGSDVYVSNRLAGPLEISLGVKRSDAQIRAAGPATAVGAAAGAGQPRRVRRQVIPAIAWA